MSRRVLGGASRVLLPVAVLASLGLRWAVVGSDGVVDLWDHVHVQFFAGIGGLGPLLFFLLQCWWPLPVALFLTMSFAGLVAFNRIRTLSSQCHFQGWWPLPVSALFFFCSAFLRCQAGRRCWRVGRQAIGGVSCVTPARGAWCGK